VKLSHAEFGVRVGAPRILSLLAARGIPSTWFAPAHTLETFPDSTAAILAGGHEIGCHGWFADGSRFGREGALVEVPVSWALDDWPHFEPSATGDSRRVVGPVEGARDLDRGAAVRRSRGGST